MSNETAKRTPKGEGETVSVTLHLPKELYDSIKSMADADERTVQQFVTRALKARFPVDGSAG